MSPNNNVVLIGRLTRDPELRYLPNGGTATTRFTLAVDKQLSREKKADMESKNQPTADFINIVVWGKQAENAANFLAKGKLCAVSGRIQTGSYEAKDGTKRYTTDVVADRVQFLDRGNQSSSAESNNVDDIDGFYTIDNGDLPF